MATSARERVTMVRVLRDPRDDDGQFDLEFWARVGAEGRFEAAWQMVTETAAVKGMDVRQSRLQRSVLRIERG